jgi:pimeloyl-ACP methyl ester carboxylesterase
MQIPSFPNFPTCHRQHQSHLMAKLLKRESHGGNVRGRPYVPRAAKVGLEDAVLTEKLFDIGSLKLNCAEGSPNGAPIAVVHGIPNRWQGMAQLLAPLETGWHVFACDMRGHGKSGRASSYRAIDYSSDIAAFVMHQIGIPTILLGHSGGAMAVLGAAAQIPDLVRAVVLLDPPFMQRESCAWPKSTNDLMVGVRDILKGERSAREVLLECLPGIDNDKVQWFAETFSCVDIEVVNALLEGRFFEGLDLASLLRQVSCPVRMFYGDVEKGALVRQSDVDFFLSIARNGSAVHVKDTGHYLHAQKPQEILGSMANWITDMASGGEP